MKLLKWIVRILMACIIGLVLMAAILGLYSLSAETGAQSGSRSYQVTALLEKAVTEQVARSPKAASFAQKAKRIIERYSPYGSNWNANVRKLAHFSIYFLIASLFYLILSILKVPLGGRWILTIVACCFLAYFDELHQGGVAGRAMSMIDVGIDTAGAALASTIYYLYGKLASL